MATVPSHNSKNLLKDVQAAHAFVDKISARIATTPPGPKRTSLEGYRDRQTRVAIRAEGWNQAIKELTKLGLIPE